MTTATRPLETGWLADTPVADTVLRQYLHNLAGSQAAWAEAAGGRSATDTGVVLADSGRPCLFMNAAVLLRPLEGPADPAPAEIDGWYGARDAVVFSAWPTGDLSHLGWELVGHPTFMVRAPGPLPEAKPADVRVVSSAADLAVAAHVAERGYPLPGVSFGSGPRGTTVRLGLLDGTPVSVAANTVADGVNHLCFAATLPAARRRGVWRALVAARLADAPDLPAVTCTSDDSRPGFERMGFLPVTRLTLWRRPGR